MQPAVNVCVCLAHPDWLFFRTSLRLMEIRGLVLGLVAMSVCVAQETDAQTFVTRIHHRKEFEGYSLDPPFWTYRAKGFRHSKTAHWVYGNHRYVFIDIEMDVANFR